MRRGGRVMMNSIRDSICNMGERLRRTLSGSSMDSTREQLSQRLETAEMALNSRAPLTVVQQGRQQHMHQHQHQHQHNADDKEHISSETDSDDNKRNHDSIPSGTPSSDSSARTTSSQRRQSLLVASRQRSSQNELFDYGLEHYENAAAVTSTGSAAENKRNKLEALYEKDGEDSSMKDSLEFGLDTDSTINPPPLPPRVLLNKSQSDTLQRSLSDGIVSGSIRQYPTDIFIRQQQQQQQKQPEAAAGSAIYSWGISGLQSFHDDDDARTAEQSKVRSDSRLGKPGAEAVTSLATSSTHSACTLARGTVMTWGQNVKGVVDPYGNNSLQLPRPTLFEPINDLNLKILQVSCGYDHTAALSEHGTVLTWGSNEYGQLGHRQRSSNRNTSSSSSSDDNQQQRQQPQTFCRPNGLVMSGGQRAAAVACGYYFTLVLTTRMCVLACGDEHITGHYSEDPMDCDDSQPEAIKTPPLATTIPALQGLPLVAIAAGHHHAIVITSLGNAYAWGENTAGACGRPFPHQLSTPVEVHVPASSTAAAITATSNQTALVPAAEKPFQHWDDSDPNNPKLPDDVAIVHACAGLAHSCFVTRSGRLLVCGSNSHGQIGVTVTESISPAEAIIHPESVRGVTFVAAEAGSFHTLLLDSDGDVWQMGGRNTDSSEGLHRVLSDKKILSIAAGGDHSIALATGEGTFRRQFSIIADDGACTFDSRSLASNLEELIEMRDVEDEDSVGEEVARRVEELLQNPSVMNSVFFDPKELDAMCTHLNSLSNPDMRQTIATAIERGITKGLESISPSKARMMYPEAVRCLLLYIRFFSRPAEQTEPAFDLHGKVISMLSETILGLPFEGYKAFVKWATTLYSGGSFTEMLVKPLIGQLDRSLKVTVDDNEVAHASLSLGSVPLIVSVLQWLNKISERMDGFAKLEDFYSRSFDLIPTEALFNDLYHLKMARKAQKRASHFHICESPFLFSPKVKQNLLQIESQLEMFKVATADGVVLNPSTGSIHLDPFWKLEVEREHMLEQTLEVIKQTKPSDLRKKLRVVFKGEEGIDAGGVTKEFFQLLSEDLFDIGSGLWTDRFGEDITWFNANCSWEVERYEAVGILVGLAVYNSTLLDVRFPMAVYRKLLGYPLGLEDMVDESLQNGFQQLLEYENESEIEFVFCLTFEVSWIDNLGEEHTRELMPGGSNIAVTGENRDEYVRLYTKWLLVDSIHKQWEAFERGVTHIVEGLSLDLLFRPEELKLLVVGSPELNFDALEANTKYEGGYSADTTVVKNFWKWIKNADRDSQTKFLKFAAGSSMSPIGGLGNLGFKIQRAGPDSIQLPTSHTCFNTLLLPEYDTFEKLEQRLSRAIVECEGFGLE